MVVKVLENGITIALPLSWLIDLDQEKARLEKELEDAKKRLINLESRLLNKAYMDKAPEKLVNQTRQDKKDVEDKIIKIQKQIDQLVITN